MKYDSPAQSRPNAYGRLIHRRISLGEGAEVTPAVGHNTVKKAGSNKKSWAAVTIKQ